MPTRHAPPGALHASRLVRHALQYMNLYALFRSMRIGDRWAVVPDLYRDVDALFGGIVKVTPSSKYVGDLAQFLSGKGIAAADVVGAMKGAIDYR